MKNFLSSIPNRIKAIYIVWAFIHFVLLLTGSLFRHRQDFYPFEYIKRKQVLTFDVDAYDYSEFLIYLLIPIIIYYVIKLWNKKDAKKPDSN